MNDSDYPKTPSDDKTDWGKTNFRHPAQPPSDDWGNTVANVRSDDADFGKTFMPGSGNAPKTPDWGATQGNIKLPQDDFSGNADRYGSSGGGGNDFGATTPYFRLPDAERAKYENVPLTPTQEAAKKQEEEKQKGGVPSWIWVSGGLTGMFLFSIIILMLAWYFLIRPSGYEATVKLAPEGSRVLVNGTYWGTTAPDGSVKLPVLKAGEEKIIEIKHPNFVCEPKKVKGQDGVKPEPIIAQCKQVASISKDCINPKAGAFKVSEDCANKALDALPADYSVDDLLRAINLYIIQFESNKFDIPAQNMVFLKRASDYMKKLPPNVVIEVGGHTDSDGTDEANKVLSDNRAKAVRSALIQFEVKPEMLTEKGYGESKPKTTNDNDDGKFQNRRIEYTAVK